MGARFLFCGLLISSLLLFAPPARSAWTPFGVVQLPGPQYLPSVASDGSLGALVSWNDSRSLPRSIYVHHVLGSGVDPAWPANGLFIGLAENDPVSAIVSDGSGGAIIGWVQGAGYDVYAQHVLSTGAIDPSWPAGGVLVCSAPGNQTGVHAVSDGAGGAILVWTDLRNAATSAEDLYAQRVLANGTVSWTANGVAVCTAVGSQTSPVAVSDGAGGIIVAWTDYRGGTFDDVFAQRLTPTGAVATGWTAGGVPLVNLASVKGAPRICSDAAGGAIVTWSDDRNVEFDVYAMRIRSTGALGQGWHKDGEPICTAGGNQQPFDMIAEGSGGAIISWADTRAGFGLTDVYVQKVTSSGANSWTTDGVAVGVAANEQISPSLGSDGAGGAYLAWQDRRFQTGLNETEIFLHRVLSTGVVDASWPANGGRVSFGGDARFGENYAQPVLATGSGNAIVFWAGAVGSGHDDLFAMGFNASWTPRRELNTTVSPASSGSVAKNPDAMAYAENTSVTLTATPSTGYAFGSWSGDANGSTNPVIVTMTSDKNVTANFVGYAVNVTISPSASGTVTKSPDQPTYAPGSQVTLTASGEFPFLSWSGDASGSTNPLILTVDGIKNVTGNFAAYTVTTTVSPAGLGTVTKNPNTTLYPPGPVTLTAVPVTGAQFSQWSGDASGSTNPLQLQVDANKIITANFTLIPPSCGNWTLASPLGQGYDLAVQWDPVNSRVLRFGGGGQGAPPQLFQFTIAGGWSQVTTAGTGPTNGRHRSGFVFDSQRNRMLVIGGVNWKESIEFDSWALSLSDPPTWSLLAGAQSRTDFTTIYDPIGDRVILFGGRNGSIYLNDVWALSLSGTPTWTQIVPSGPTPPGRYAHAAIYDPVRDRMIIHGGIGSGPILGDTWALSLAGTPSWSQISATGAPPLYYPAAAYDPVRDRMVVLGGLYGPMFANSDGTWFLSLETQPFWTMLPTGPVSMGVRFEHQAVYEPDIDVILVMGGQYGTGFYTDTRRLDCAGGWWLQTGASNGTVQVVPSKVCYTPGDQVTLVASPASGSMFDHWLGDASGNGNPLDVTMDATKTIYAQMADRTTGVEDMPVAFALRVAPNPSVGPVTVEYSLPREDRVRLSVFDVAGREVARLVDGVQPAGRHVAAWESAMGRAGAGIYLVRYETPAGSWTRRLALLH